jgi:glycine/D-amino acid oxidase-like deaminating enzyme
LNKTFDLVILGGGSAGLTAASFAVQLGARVALVEKHRIGGDCTWTGGVPSKTLLKTAKVAHEMRTAGRYGLSAVAPEVDLKAVMEHVRPAILNLSQTQHEKIVTNGNRYSERKETADLQVNGETGSAALRERMEGRQSSRYSDPSFEQGAIPAYSERGRKVASSDKCRRASQAPEQDQDADT